MIKQLDNSFITYASEILADTDTGLSGTKIVEYCNAFAIDYNKIIPHTQIPFDAPNKRTALKENIQSFESDQQFQIIKKMTELPFFEGNEKVHELKIKLFQRYGEYATDKISETELVIKTRHWLGKYDRALKQYENALIKYESGIFERNTLDDMRLAFELLIKDLLQNDKSLENQISDIGTQLKNNGASSELRNMVIKMIDYYTKYQDNHVKHNDLVNKDEIEFIIEQTSVLMKYMIKICGE